MADGGKLNSEASLRISPAHAGALAARMLILEEDCRDSTSGCFWQVDTH